MNWKEKPWPVIDTETTSKYANQARVVQLGMYCDEVSWERFVNPGCEVPQDVVVAMKWTPEELDQIRSARPFSAYARQLEAGIKRHGFVVGYNFDSYYREVLTNELKRIGMDWPKVPIIDVMILARWCLIPTWKESNFQLGTVAAFFGIHETAHRAAGDCKMTHEILKRLCIYLPDDLDSLMAIQQDAVSVPFYTKAGSELYLQAPGKNPALKIGMGPETVMQLDLGYHNWMCSKMSREQIKILQAAMSPDVPF